MNIADFLTELYCKIDDALPEQGNRISDHSKNQAKLAPEIWLIEVRGSDGQYTAFDCGTVWNT